MISLCIHGAAGMVTGSCHRLITPSGELLIDCGLFQGPKSLRALNYRSFPLDAAGIAAVLLTHAHIDHTGLFPKLALAGSTAASGRPTPRAICCAGCCRTPERSRRMTSSV